jgi:hypothetical protein
MATFTDAEKKTAVLVELVKGGVVDLDSLADGIVKRLPAEFDPNNPTATQLGAGACLVGRWYVYVAVD